MGRELVECGKCLFWETVNGELGHCRRHAPQVMFFSTTDVLREASDENLETYPTWPKTLADEWCGEGERGQP